ncbi:O-acetylserine/cysteine efflux transporter [Agromyces flavus]|uniref:O-acetylserine/cysteine efflux transporter n=2 Tax=Agromyces flavus TaxID=589382 RepID=A0ABT1KJS1_9MICO|nr:EamA family transporter [Agromyces flavus]MCP2366087.1 O-acetylserine/cysteine efflux transporter [Agromyces flavus]
MTRRDMLLAALVATMWGFNFVVIDWGMDGIPPLFFVAIRFAVVALAVVVVPRPLASWKTVVGVGLFMSLGQFALLYTSIALGLQPGIAALLLQAQVVLTILVAALALRERPTHLQVAGVLLGTVGLGIVAFGRGGDAPALAVVLCLLAALSWAVGNVVARRAGPVAPARRLGALSLTVWSSLVVPLPALGLSALIEGPDAIAAGIVAFGWRPLLSTLYTAGLCTLVGYAIFNGLLARNRSASVVPWVLLAPVVAMLSAALLLGQVPNVWETAGGAVLVAGVFVANAPGRRRAAARADGAVPESSPAPEASDLQAIAPQSR